ncbi:MAG: ABC transporter substrate-binding protein [Patescibacteria group bacterium]|nr:ABC transporter substrate-binding protein [Patescibacteria group bacterium]
MKTKIFFSVGFLILGSVLVFVLLFLHKDPNKTKEITFTVALDWTPNTNHTGLYVALAKGWYKAAGLAVTILPYSSSTSPDVLVSNGKADVGVGATEGILADAATGSPVVSIAAILAHNTSGFIALSDSGITRPRDFDGKIYGGGGTPTETAIVSAIIKKDGGKGDFKNVSLDVEAMQALETKKVDFVWVFEGWEVIQAKRQGYKVNYFPSLSYGIPDYYTPNLIASPKEIAQKPELLKKFMAATSKGYAYAVSHPKESAQILIAAAPKGTFPDPNFVIASQQFLSTKYADPGKPWGVQTAEGWHDYPQFLLNAGAILDANGKPVKSLDLDTLYTNKFVQ